MVTSTNSERQVSEFKSHSTRQYVPPFMLVLGMVLIVTSWTPLCQIATGLHWDREDTVLYGELAKENHRLAYQPLATSGATEEELMTRRKEVKDALDAMIEKLESAKTRPGDWSRFLRWTGAVSVAIGLLLHLRSQNATKDLSG